MYKNLSTSALRISGSQSEIIELVLTYGFRAMDLKVVEFAQRAKTRGMPYAKRLIESAKILVSSFDLPIDLEAGEDAFKKGLESLPGLAEVAAEVGCTRCLTMVAPAGDQLPYHENFERHRVRLGEICQALAPSGVRLGVGFRAAPELRKDKAFQFIHENDALGLLLSMVNAPNLGMVLDVWDLCVSGGSIEQIGGMDLSKIVSVRVADAPEETPLAELTEEARLLPGQTGRLKIPTVLRTLAERGYDGPITPAPHRKVLGTSRRDPIVRKLGEAMKAVWKTAGLNAQGKVAGPMEVAEPTNPATAVS
ncbi:MAG: sugar phosphate isomerase/epimerase [Pirellulales bacterium]|nr:sugar phosphate isomerase/epimerase [Pirellulales bacterium]